jgi:hypothetical protein
MTPFIPFNNHPPLFEGAAPSPAAIAVLQAHPRFPEAMRAIAVGTVSLYGGNRLLNAVLTDRGRYLMGVFALHLHFSSRPGDPRSALTVSRMRSLCAEHKICSPGRAEAMLILMRFFGHLTSAPSETDRRLRRLVPSEGLIAWHRARCKFVFEAAARLSPVGTQALSALESPDFQPSFIRHLCQSHFAGFYYVDHVPEMRKFYDRSGGVGVLMQLLLAGEGDDCFPPERPVSLSLSALARSFGVSRAHVRRLINDCIREGLLERTRPDGDTFRVLPPLADAVRKLMAVYLLHHLHCAGAALAEEGHASAVA